MSRGSTNARAGKRGALVAMAIVAAVALVGLAAWRWYPSRPTGSPARTDVRPTASVPFVCPRCNATCRLPAAVGDVLCPYCGTRMVDAPLATPVAATATVSPIVVRAGTPPPHAPRGACTNCHTVVNAIATPPAGTAPAATWQGVAAPPIPAGATAPILIKQFGMEVVSAPGTGARVTGVMGNSYADTAGIVPGDVVLELNQNKVRDANDLEKLALKLAPEANAQLMILRGGRTRDLKVMVGEGEMEGFTPIKPPRTATAAPSGQAGMAPVTPAQVVAQATWQNVAAASDVIQIRALGLDVVPAAVDGARVTNVYAASSAQKAGVLVGDTIVECNGVKIRDAQQLLALVNQARPETEAGLNLVRNGRMRKVPVLVGEGEFVQAAAQVTPAAALDLPSPRQQNAAAKEFIEGHWVGLEGIPLTPELAKEYQIPAGESGVLVDEVTLEAAESGILAGDMVQAVNGVATPDLRQFFAATRRVQDEKRSKVDVSRRGKRLTFIMEARNAPTLGFAQMEAAQPIQPGALSPHRARGKACTSCHVIMMTGGQLPTDAGDILPNPPPIAAGATPPHRPRGQCSACHVIK